MGREKEKKGRGHEERGERKGRKGDYALRQERPPLSIICFSVLRAKTHRRREKGWERRGEGGKGEASRVGKGERKGRRSGERVCAGMFPAAHSLIDSCIGVGFVEPEPGEPSTRGGGNGKKKVCCLGGKRGAGRVVI